MSNEGRRAYVQEHLTDALLVLLQEKPLADISISELCDLAGVGRASFYRNYGSMEGILLAENKRRIQLWSAAYEASDKSLPKTIETLFQHLEANRDYYCLLDKNGLLHLLKAGIIEACGPKPEYPKEIAYSTAFVAYTLYGWMETWFARGMKETAEEMAQLFHDTASKQS